MKRLLLTLLMITALLVMSSLPHSVAARGASVNRNVPTGDSTCDGYDGHWNDGPQYYNVSGHNIKDIGDACLAFGPSYPPSGCPEDYCWDVQASTTISPSVYKTFAQASGWDECGTMGFNQEMIANQWDNGSISVTLITYGTFMDCDGQGHTYQGDYGHFFEYSKTSGSLGFTTCYYSSPCV